MRDHDDPADLDSRVTQTARSFRKKWEENPRLLFDERSAQASGILGWILHRNGWADLGHLRTHIRSRRRLLDAGCGNGRMTAVLADLSSAGAVVTGVDINPGVAASNLADRANVEIIGADLVLGLDSMRSFDFVYCQEVLHHTSDPRLAFGNLVRVLEPGGEIAIYVYREKGPIREFVDDFVRSHVADMSYEQARETMRAITDLGRHLADSGHTVTVPDVPLLGIEAGEYDIQRFVYHFFMKCFWNAALSFEDNVAINHDWYHPALSSRHTVGEVRQWFIEEGLSVTHEFVDPYGITMHGRKPEAAPD